MFRHSYPLAASLCTEIILIQLLLWWLLLITVKHYWRGMFIIVCQGKEVAFIGCSGLKKRVSSPLVSEEERLLREGVGQKSEPSF